MGQTPVSCDIFRFHALSCGLFSVSFWPFVLALHAITCVYYLWTFSAIYFCFGPSCNHLFLLSVDVFWPFILALAPHITSLCVICVEGFGHLFCFGPSCCNTKCKMRVVSETEELVSAAALA
jgi:hypothetical protein